MRGVSDALAAMMRKDKIQQVDARLAT